MIRGLYTSSAGMQVEQLRQEAIANNLANLNTAGFRRDLTIVEARKTLTLSRTHNPTSADPLSSTRSVGVGKLGMGVDVNRFVKDFRQGDIHETGNPYDLAVSGPGFLQVQGPDGKTYYSRDGQFTRSREGYMEDKAGCKLLGQNGPLVINGKLQITTEGTVMVDGKVVDKVATAAFDNPDVQLMKHGDTMFQSIPGTPVKPADKLEINQGALEAANVNSVEEMVSMIAALRQYESNQKAVQAQDETLSRAVNDIAK